LFIDRLCDDVQGDRLLALEHGKLRSLVAGVSAPGFSLSPVGDKEIKTYTQMTLSPITLKEYCGETILERSKHFGGEKGVITCQIHVKS
jgi:hypothetical protein